MYMARTKIRRLSYDLVPANYYASFFLLKIKVV